MKTTDFENFKLSLNLNIEVDASLRRITEKIKFIAQQRDPELLSYVLDFLRDADEDINHLITNQICSDECEEK